MKGQVCSKGGKHPHWNDAITIPATQPKVTVEVMDKDRVTHDDQIGSFTLDLREAQATGQVSKWYPLSYKDRSAGEIFLEVVYQGGGTPRQAYSPYYSADNSILSGQNQSSYQGQQYAGAGLVGTSVLGSQSYGQGQQYAGSNVYGNQGQYYNQGQRYVGAGALDTQSYSQGQQYASSNVYGGQSQSSYQKQQYASTNVYGSKAQYSSQHGSQYYQQNQQHSSHYANQESHHNVWTEQVQVVKPHVFTKEIEVIETRPVLKEVEIMEPVTVLKDVQYTQAVPVKKQIEVSRPEVVIKEIEVMEPRVITKTIQVVENVTVSRPVQFVEMRSSIQEVETFEPQTFHKPIEVTEYKPVKKQIEVTQPVTLKKAVEFVEPIITTQTITKEMMEPVIVNQEITKTVGPASVVAMSSEYGYIKQFSELSLTETKHLGGLKRWVGYETLFNGLTDEERLWEQQRLNRLSEQEWLRERERLMRLNQEERLLQQRSFFQKLRDSFSSRSTFQYSNRWNGHDNWWVGLNDKEKFYAQNRINRMNEQEWLNEKERLMKLNEQDRLLEYRTWYKNAMNDGQGFAYSTQFGWGPNFQGSQPL